MAEKKATTRRRGSGCGNPPIDFTGEKKGLLLVLGRAPSDKRGCAMWQCICDCGKPAVVSRRLLRQSRLPSCGCVTGKLRGIRPKKIKPPKPPKSPPANFIDMTGKDYGKLTVVGRVERPEGRKDAAALWLCSCSCGNTTVAEGRKIRSGAVASCGCARGTGEVLRSDQVRATQNKRIKDRYRTEPRFALNRRIRTRMRTCLRGRGGIAKRASWQAAVGYTIAELEERLRQTMPPGHTWDDFLANKLEVDHIRELWRFDFASMDDPGFKEAWALSNLQLLTTEEHLKKCSADKRSGTEWLKRRRGARVSPSASGCAA